MSWRSAIEYLSPFVLEQAALKQFITLSAKLVSRQFQISDLTILFDKAFIRADERYSSAHFLGKATFNYFWA